MGASRLERAEPHGGSPGQENYFTARTLDSTLGAYVGLGEVTCTYPLAYVGNSNFKLKFQFYGSSPGYLLRLMFVYTTRDIYLTRRNFQNQIEIYSINFHEITIWYPWPSINSYEFVMNNINMLYAI
jgi:hypothetical protein